ncbi:MAG TPA: SPOR domain-containing protein [Terriglobales bacterium]
MAETETDERESTEITLGTGKLLGIFFGLVLLCSLFFAMGYMLGRSNANGTKTEIVSGEPTGGSAAGKPSAADKTPSPAPVTVVPAGSNASASTPAAAVPASASSSAPPALVPASASNSANLNPNAASGGAYLVQVAAVSKHEDADILASALQKKQYPAFVGNATGDTLFHVLVGPLTDPKDAETMRSRLAADGYNAIVKSK